MPPTPTEQLHYISHSQSQPIKLTVQNNFRILALLIHLPNILIHPKMGRNVLENRDSMHNTII